MFTRINGLRPTAWTLFLYVLISTFIFSSCSKDDEDLVGEYAQGYLVVNEGVFGKNNATVGHISKNEMVTQQIFQTVNGDSLGDNLQSVSILGDEAYLLVSNSNKIEVVNRGTFERKATITGNFANPRYMASVGNNRAYVSSWGNFGNIGSAILVVDTNTEQVVSTIDAGAGPENVVYSQSANKVFIANTFESSISVYDVSSNTLEATIDVSPNSPKDMVTDKDGKIWVTASAFGSSEGALHKINPTTNAIETTIELNAGSENIGQQLAINPAKDILYYNFSSGVYALSITATTQAASPLIQNGAYGVSVEPSNGDIWIGIANFSAPTGNEVIRYDSEGNAKGTFTASAGPNEVIFLP
ncbi:DUF5074 domain-containing protein [Bernardetia sp.]|uniref:DUF5074 domain-containing protein n=1 Tax=Bernardetia sp. TaxID=1937974 RepID=UPI0025C38D8C|nr:DUF5074 domain-containing protein [Bernardetia sp.]